MSRLGVTPADSTRRLAELPAKLAATIFVARPADTHLLWRTPGDALHVTVTREFSHDLLLNEVFRCENVNVSAHFGGRCSS